MARLITESRTRHGELSTNRLRLWMPGPEYAADVLDYYLRNRRHLERWAPSTRRTADTIYTVEFWQKQLARSVREHAEGRAVRFVISWKDEEPPRILGTCNLTALTRGAYQSCELGYGLDEHEQGKGIMTEALRAVITLAFGPLALHRITASYMPSNERSGALLKRLGFTVEGYARDYLLINGVWCDHLLTALLNPAPAEPVS